MMFSTKVEDHKFLLNFGDAICVSPFSLTQISGSPGKQPHHSFTVS